ncbi:uncharacterized protein LOC116612667 isoform X1 [Nematostella vectensis]|uniref:uncharacterized protein LOC116612667 isoform X1 n=1 Tax=Nematostella vectensis TaxID=45351 RepID=UPI002076F750|nr:uncharacterized protein LOC116612667 isoform X1 [Nematostella vectensis]
MNGMLGISGTANTEEQIDVDKHQITNKASTSSFEETITAGTTGGTQDQQAAQETLTCSFKTEKPKLPKFSGDVKEYVIFKSDWNHIIYKRYMKRDAMTLLRASLTDKPLELIKGIGTDYDAAWEYLDAIYGDPRVVSDSVTQDISKFKALQDGEDSRFCELVHLVRRSYNTLKEVGLSGDVDNSHMLSVIERKMSADDRKVWSRELERDKKTATLEGLLQWMTSEMKSRMRATAAVRSGNTTYRGGVYQFKADEQENPRFKWHCKNSEHWPDQYPKFAALTYEKRMKTAKENHVCFSCLKVAGRNHKASTCSRKKVCNKSENGEHCQAFHHPLLHKTIPVSVGTALESENTSVILPVLTANIHGQKQANVLLDTGAQISLIRNDTADLLGLVGKDTYITITKVGGEDKSMKTKVYKVPVCSNGRSK